MQHLIISAAVSFGHGKATFEYHGVYDRERLMFSLNLPTGDPVQIRLPASRPEQLIQKIETWMGTWLRQKISERLQVSIHVRTAEPDEAEPNAAATSPDEECLVPIAIPHLVEDHDALEEKLSPLRRAGYRVTGLGRASGRENRIRIFFPVGVWEEIMEFAGHDTKCEVAGDVFGDIFKDPDGPYIEVSGQIPGKYMQASGTFARDTDESKQYYFQELDKRFSRSKTVAWYHTHPGLGVFLSGTDRKTKETAYPLWYQVAIVIDPVRQEAGFFYGQKKEIKDIDQVYLYQPAPAGGLPLRIVGEAPR